MSHRVAGKPVWRVVRDPRPHLPWSLEYGRWHRQTVWSNRGTATRWTFQVEYEEHYATRHEARGAQRQRWRPAIDGTEADAP